MNLLFSALEDRAPVRTDSSDNAGFTRRVMLVRRSFYLDTITLLVKHNAKNLGAGQSVDVLFFNMHQHNMIIRVSGQSRRNKWSTCAAQVVNLARNTQ